VRRDLDSQSHSQPGCHIAACSWLHRLYFCISEVAAEASQADGTGRYNRARQEVAGRPAVASLLSE